MAPAPLRPLPESFPQTRLDLHRVAALVMSPTRRQAMGKMGLCRTPGGFGTPPFERDGQPTIIRMEATDEGAGLVVERDGRVDTAPITTIAAAGVFCGTPPDLEWAAGLDIPAPGNPERTLQIDPEAARALADWYAFGWSILVELAAEEASIEASQPQLWPEHFDPAIEIGNADAKQRASYGFSPGDVAKTADPGPEPLPYAYVGPWFADDRPTSSFWNASSFPGALLHHHEIVAVGPSHAEQRNAVLAFLRKGRSLLVDGQ